MNVRPSILCPIDYSHASVGALRYAAAVAEHFVTRLIVLNVRDPLLMPPTHDSADRRFDREEAERGIAKFVRRVCGDDASMLEMCEYDAAVGTPAAEIVRIARERSCDVIVMSSHGVTETSALMFGSTTERVLRETTVPVLVTPPVDPGPIHVEDANRLIGRVAVPVDLSPWSFHQTRVACGLAESLALPLTLVHVIEPVKGPSGARDEPAAAGLDPRRRAAAEQGLHDLLVTVPSRLRPEALVACGDPAEEAAKIVRDRHAGLVVMGLHGAPGFGPRMGSVTYRMLCLTPTLVLALPPKHAPAARHAHGMTAVAS